MVISYFCRARLSASRPNGSFAIYMVDTWIFYLGFVLIFLLNYLRCWHHSQFLVVGVLAGGVFFVNISSNLG